MRIRAKQAGTGQSENSLQDYVVAEPHTKYGAELFEQYQREHGAGQMVQATGQTVTQEV